MARQAQEGGDARLPLWRIGIFSAPVLAFQAIELPWRIYLPGFFSQGLGLSLATVGALLTGIRLFDMALDPFVGWLSDRFPTRFGLRRPWMAAGVPLVLIGRCWDRKQPTINIVALNGSLVGGGYRVGTVETDQFTAFACVGSNVRLWRKLPN